MLLDMLAAIGRKDYEDRRHRQAQGKMTAMVIASTEYSGLYKAHCECAGELNGLIGSLPQVRASCSRSSTRPTAEGAPSRKTVAFSQSSHILGACDLVPPWAH
jgi:hypothetical protein